MDVSARLNTTLTSMLCLFSDDTNMDVSARLTDDTNKHNM